MLLFASRLAGGEFRTGGDPDGIQSILPFRNFVSEASIASQSVNVKTPERCNNGQNCTKSQYNRVIAPQGCQFLFPKLSPIGENGVGK